ncbi:MAG: acyl-CoA ligase (AMP-forming), exosortase A system-associated [Pseudomonadota bacterium]
MAGLVFDSAQRTPDAPALFDRRGAMTYHELAAAVAGSAGWMAGLGLEKGARVALFLPKQRETVIALFAAAAAGLTAVPVNPGLKAAQVLHILHDSATSLLVTSSDRLRALGPLRQLSPHLSHVLLTGPRLDQSKDMPPLFGWQDQPCKGDIKIINTNPLAAILYTSGSTGRPKGVMLSHDNLRLGADSVVRYLENGPEDRILALLPLSFDYGLNQLTSGFLAGAQVVLHDYFLAQDVVRAVERHAITGLGCVPPLWHHLAAQPWPPATAAHLRYITNSGGAMPRPLLERLQAIFSRAKIYLMYGLTEAFRATYLDPALVNARPTSIGKAIPHAEVLVLRPDGSECAVDEPGELVQVGPLVAQGYWRDEARTAARFRPAPAASRLAKPGERAVWSGDKARRDADGFFYFLGRDDEMIKTSGYRVSPTEVEEAVLASGLVAEAVALGVADEVLGQSIALAAVAAPGRAADDEALLGHCRKVLPSYMVPARVHWLAALARTANGKIDRAGVARRVRGEAA